MNPTLYRKRLIPFETVPLVHDRILAMHSDRIFTAWQTLHPKHDLAYGYSCYFPKLGIKVSRFYNHQHEFMFWYCDIIDTSFDPQTKSYTFTDLLADVEVYPDGHVKILDLDELADAAEQGLLSEPLLLLALRRLHHLLSVIESGHFSELTMELMEWVHRTPPEEI